MRENSFSQKGLMDVRRANDAEDAPFQSIIDEYSIDIPRIHDFILNAIQFNRVPLHDDDNNNEQQQQQQQPLPQWECDKLVSLLQGCPSTVNSFITNGRYVT